MTTMPEQEVEPAEPDDEVYDLDFDSDVEDKLIADVAAEMGRTRPMRVRVAGREITVPPRSEWPTRAAMTIEQPDSPKDWFGAVRTIFGEEAADFLLDQPISVLMSIIAKAMDGSGANDRGESQRSAPSSRSTRKRSKRT